MTAADLTALEEQAAVFATGAATALRASPMTEATRQVLWERFRLDYNDQRVRCRQVVTLAERYEEAARQIRSQDCYYPCSLAGEPEPSESCGPAADAVTYVRTFGHDSIALCSTFWGLSAADQKSALLLHEWIHYLFVRRGAFDEPTRGFDTAGCYATFAVEVSSTPWVNTAAYAQCPSNPDPLPDRNDTRIALGCPSNVFTTLGFGGLFNYGFLGGVPRVGASIGLDVNIPLTTMHDWEFSVGPRFSTLQPTDPTEREVLTAGLRLALGFRYRPWRFGWELGGYVEPGVASLAASPALGPAATTPPEPQTWHPYLGAGVTPGLHWTLSSDAALRLFLDVGGGVGRDSRTDRYFPFFQTGLNLGFETR